MVQSQDSEQLLLQQQLPTFPTFLCPDPDWPDHDTSGQLGQVFPDEQNLLQRYGSSNSLSDLSLGHLSSPREHHLLDRKGATMPLPVESPGGFLDNTLASMLDRQLMLSASAPVGYTFPSTSGLSEGAGLLNMAAQRDAFRTLTEEDVFSSCGGLELGAEAALGDLAAQRQFLDTMQHFIAGGNGQLAGILPAHLSGNSLAGEHPFGEHPSRTLFVRNINWSVEETELRALFESYGEIRAVYTACKHRGFVMVSYYDLRSAKAAMRGLQGRVVRRRRLDIHYSIPKDNPNDRDSNQGTLVVFNLDQSVTNEELCRVFSQFGEVKEIRETPKKTNHKFVEYYDVRAAANAMQSLNNTEVCGKRIKLEPSRPGGSRRTVLNQQQQRILAEDEKRSYLHSVNQPWMIPAARARPPRPASTSLAFLASDPHSTYSAPSMPQLLQMAGSPYAPDQVQGSSFGSHGSGGFGGSSNSSVGSVFAASLQQHQQPGLPAPLSVRPGAPVVSGLSASLQSQANAAAAIQAAAAAQLSTSGGLLADPLKNVDLVALAAAAQQQQQMQAQLSSLAAAGWPYDALKAQALASTLANQMEQQQQSSNNLGSSGPVSISQPRPPRGNPININGMSATQVSQGGQLYSMPSSAPLQLGQVWGPPDPSSSPGQKYAQGLPISPVGSPWSSTDHPSLGSFPGSQPSMNGLLGSLSVERTSTPNLQELAFQQQFHRGFARSASAADAISLAAAGIPSLHLDNQLDAGLTNLLNRLSRNSGYHPDVFFGDQQDRADRQTLRPSRRGSGSTGGDPVADANRKAHQERMFGLDLGKVLRGEDHRTTLMIKNIPNKYTQKMLLSTIDELLSRTYDFFYLPIDFKNKCNMGYAFINMVSPQYILPLVERFNNRKWDKFNSEKVASITYARIQGKAALVSHFQNSSLMHEDKHCRPIIFASDGVAAGLQEPFPIGPNVRARATRASRDRKGSMNNLACAGSEPSSSLLETGLSTSY